MKIFFAKCFASLVKGKYNWCEILLLASAYQLEEKLIKMNLMRRSIRNFNTPPPRAYPGHLTVHRARGGGNLNVALQGWEFEPDLSLVLT